MVVLLSVWQCNVLTKTKLCEVMYEYQAEHGALHIVGGCQSAWSWVSGTIVLVC